MIDFAALWNKTIRDHPNARHLEAVDTAFWEEHACANAAWSRGIPNTLVCVRSSLSSSDSLLDVGAGTGRFALQLAPGVRCVSALDYSEAMLQQLRVKQQTLGITNVTTQLGNLNTATLEPHDTVLAAWSLYSSDNITATLERLLHLSKKQLIILEDDSSGSPHRQWYQKLWQPRPTPMPKYLVLTGVLWQLGVRAEVRIIREMSTVQFEDRKALLLRFCPQDADKASKDYFLEQLTPYLTPSHEGLTYAYPFEVAMIHWQHKALPLRTFL